MPILNPKYNHVKVYRPKGTQYAKALMPNEGYSPASDGAFALQTAFDKFKDEFGRKPERSRCVAELVFARENVVATVFELPEEIQKVVA